MEKVRSFAIVGRPNVGKSTLFNRLLGKKRSIVHDTPGVTRDWQRYFCTLQGMSICLYDTPGIENIGHNSPLSSITQVQALLWIFDGSKGITPQDEHLSKQLRKLDIPLILVANKCESERSHPFALSESLRLGIADPVMISALHGHGMEELYQRLAHFPPQDNAIETAPSHDTIAISIIGRPNAGKSTLVNRFLGYDRMQVQAQAGTTTDAVVSTGPWKNHTFRLVDTAGMRKKNNVHDPIEKLSCQESYRALVFSHVTLVLIDASAGDFSRQDALLVRKATDEGRAVIIGLSKWDAVPDPKDYLYKIPLSLEKYPICPFSSLSGKGVNALWDQVIQSYVHWDKRLPTGPLNRWLSDKVKRHPAPLLKGHRIKIKYMTQIKTRPPTFSLFGYAVTSLPDSYQSYLINGLTNDFGLSSPRFILRNIDNPYASKGSKKR
jgi:GTP-binding protein